MIDSASSGVAAQSGSRFPWLDWLRFLSALMVVFVHARNLFFVEFGALPVDQKTPLVAAGCSLNRAATTRNSCTGTDWPASASPELAR